MTTKTKSRYLVKVIWWAGTTQCEAFCSDYQSAMEVASRNQNKYSPTFFEVETGEELYDDGYGLRYADRAVYVV